MVFIAGPRQAGKSTLAEDVLKIFSYSGQGRGVSFNWDNDKDRLNILKKRWGPLDQLLLFDEAKRWRRERFEEILMNDIRDLEDIKSLATLGLFVQLLRTRVGSPVVLN